MNRIDNLAIKYKTGDLTPFKADRLKSEVIEHAQGYINSILKKTNVPRNVPYDYDDLKQEANMMVLRALENFDVDNGAKFSTYMYLRVSGRVVSYIRKHDILTRGKRKLLGELKGARHSMEQSLGRTVTYKEISDEIGISPDVINTLSEAEALRRSGSNDCSSGTSKEILDNSLEEKFDKDWLFWKLSKLPVRDRLLLVAMFLLDLDGRECAMLLDYNDRHYIYRLKNKILDNFE